jgi:hypothetical protein
MFVIGTKIRPARTTGNSKGLIIGCSMEQAFYRSIMINHFSRKKIYKKSGYEKIFIPIFERHRGISKQCKTNFNNVMMLAFSRTILLMSIRT